MAVNAKQIKERLEWINMCFYKTMTRISTTEVLGKKESFEENGSKNGSLYLESETAEMSKKHNERKGVLETLRLTGHAEGKSGRGNL